MSYGKLILGATLIGLPIVGLCYYNYIVSNYDYSIGSVTPVTLNGANSTIQITVNITSRIGIAFTINDIYFDIYIQGYKVGNVIEQQPVVVPNFGSTQIFLLANVDLTMVENDLAGILVSSLNGGSTNVSLVGYSHVRVGVLPFSTNVALKEGYTLSI